MGAGAIGTLGNGTDKPVMGAGPNDVSSYLAGLSMQRSGAASPVSRERRREPRIPCSAA
jgi:hypothetical protein